ncbi:hypothetical protein [Nannocystis bainbridge]|uniref:Uncharacterized protein n=1 Tax=Nannocystis bainbridge TaxID=2995303 RepID=A0ABT5E140_9BACT|nr:hypothetical protein [Nannocystis bainbridge]MDC0719554.1 hypothetical protein [Nannocystis bainbridge]
MLATSVRPARAPAAAAILGLLALLGFDAAAAAPGGASTNLTAATPPAPTSAPPIGAPKGAGEVKPRMWATSLSNMVVYENGSGYLYGFWRQFGEAAEKPARLYWGRGCPDISDRVYHVLQAGFAQQHQYLLVVDRDPDPRQPGAFCVRGVELESRFAPHPPALVDPAPTPTARPPAHAPAPGSK